MREVANKEIHNIQTDGHGEITKFSMAADGFMFDNLISNLYSDKVASVLREIISNAIDAHAMCKRDERPIDVILPTPFSPTFSVRDYGDGMSDSFIKELYSIVGHSEKRRTNIATGMFGLGSKSPFALTDTFTVTVFRNGEKRVYNAHRLADRTPALRNMSVSVERDYEPSTEPDGVLVTIPIALNDIPKFESALRKNSFAYYDTNIKFSRKLSGDDVDVMDNVRRDMTEFIPGLFQIKWSKADYSYSYGNLGKLYIRQGSAIYHLAEEQLAVVKFNYATYDEMRSFSEVSNFLRQGKTDILFNVPLGTSAVTPSREAISYDERTIANLSKVYADYMRAVLDKIFLMIGDARTHRDAILKVMASYAPDKQKVWASFEAAQEIVKFSNSRIQDNWTSWRNKLPKDVKELTPVNSSALTVFEVSREFPGMNVNMFSGYSSAPTSLAGKWPIEKSAKSKFSFPTIGFIVPFGVKDWELRVKQRLTFDETFNGYDLVGANNVRVAILRCKKADIDIVRAKMEAVDAFITIDVFDEVAWPAIPHSERDNKTRNQRYSKNAVFILDGKTWTDTKVEVDFTTPAYYITRNGVNHDNILITGEERATFNDARHWAADSTCIGLRLHSTVNIYNIRKIVDEATKLGFIDKALPIYRLTPLQAARLKDIPGNGLIPLFTTIINKLVIEKEAYIASKVLKAGSTDSYCSISGYCSRWLDTRSAMTTAKFAKMCEDDDYNAQREFVEVALSDPTQAYAIALYTLRSLNEGPLYDHIVKATGHDHKWDNDIFSLCNKMFVVPFDELADEDFVSTAVKRFGLLENKPLVEPTTFKHATLYMRAIIADMPPTKVVPDTFTVIIDSFKELVTIPLTCAH